MARFNFLFSERDDLFRLGAILLEVAAASEKFPLTIVANGSVESGKTAVLDGILQAAQVEKLYSANQAMRHNEVHVLDVPYKGLRSIFFTPRAYGDIPKGYDLRFLSNQDPAASDISVFIESGYIDYVGDYARALPERYLANKLPASLKKVFLDKVTADSKSFLRLVEIDISDELLQNTEVRALVENSGFVSLAPILRDNLSEGTKPASMHDVLVQHPAIGNLLLR